MANSIQYDDILLNISSSADTNGIENSIKALQKLKGVFDAEGVSGIQDAAKAMKEFASALNSMDKNVVNAIAKIKGNFTKVASAAKNATTAITKAQKADAPQLNANKDDIRKAISENYNPSATTLKDMGYDPKAIREVKEEMRQANAQAKETASFKKFLADAEKSVANSEKILAEQTAKAEAKAAAEAKKKALEEAKATAEMEKQKAELQELLVDPTWKDMLNDRDDLMDNYGKKSFEEAANSYQAPEVYWNPERVAEQNAEANAELEKITSTISKGADEADRFEQNVRQLAQDLLNGPPTSNSFLKQQGYTQQEIVAAKQELANMKWEAKQAGNAMKEMASSLEQTAPAVAKVKTEMQEIGEAIDKDITDSFEYQTVWERIKEAFEDYKESLREGVKSYEEEFLEKFEDYPAHIEETADSVKKVGKAAEEAKNPLQKFADRLKKIIEYRVLRSIITGIGNALKGGITNLEQWSRRTGMSDFYKSIDIARESWEVLKNSFAVVAAPALQWLIGIFQKIAQMVMAAANAVSRFFAILGGKSTYTAVKWAEYSAKATDDYGHSIGKATDEAKEFKRQLMGFDEINNLTAQSDGGSGGGGGGGASGGGFNFTDMFEEKETGAATQFETKLKSIISKVKDLLNQLAPVKTALAGIRTTVKQVTTSFKNLFAKFKVWMSHIDWADLWQTLRKVIFAAVDAFVEFVSYLGTVISTMADMLGVVGDVIDSFNGWNAIGIILKGTLLAIQAVFDTFNIALIGLEAILKSVAAVFEYLGTVASEFFKALSGKQSWSDFKKNCAEATENMKQKISEASETAAQKVEAIFKKRYSMGFTLTVKLKEVDISGLGPATMTYESYANGGFPTAGSLFIANEAGPEMVGTIGGSTAVATNDDIVSAVSQGVASAVASVLGGGTNVNVVLEGDANKLFRVVQSQARNYAIQTGSYAFG